MAWGANYQFHNLLSHEILDGVKKGADLLIKLRF